MSVKVIVAWAWALMVSVGWLAISILQQDDLTAFGIPAGMTLVLGALVMTRVSGNPIGLIMVVAGSAWLIYTGGIQYATLSLANGPFPGEYLAAWLGTWTGPIFFASFPALLLLFPDGRAQGWRRVALIGLGLIPLAAVVGAVQLWGVPAEVLVAPKGLDQVSEYALVDQAFVLGLYSAIPATLSIVLRFRQGDRVSRQQIKWLLAGSVAFSIGLIAGVLGPGGDSSSWWLLVLVVGMSLFPIAIGIAVFRYRLYDLGRVVSRSVTYAAVIGLLGAAVAVVAAMAGAQFEEPWVVAATTLGVAALFNPLRNRVQAWLERRFNRSHYDAELVMVGFAGALRERVDPDEVLTGWVTVVSSTMEPSGLSLWVRE